MLTAMKGFEEKSSADGVASPMATLNLQRTKPSGKHQDGVKAIGLKAQEVIYVASGRRRALFPNPIL